MTTFQKLKAELDKGQKNKLYIFTGEEREVLHQYIKRIDSNVKKVSCVKQLWNILSSKNLFSKVGTYLIENDKDILQLDLNQLLKKIGDNTLIIVVDSIDNRMKFFKQAKPYIVNFDKFNERQLVGYIQSKIDIDSRLAHILAIYCNNEVSRIDNEIHKLSHVNQDITLELINLLVVPTVEDRVFDMVDAVAKQEKEKVFQLYADLMELRESPIKLVSLLYSKFKQIFLVQSYLDLPNHELCAKTGLTFYQVNFARELSGRLSLNRILDILMSIQKTEVEMKTGQIDIELGMDNLLIEILGGK